MKFIRLIIIFLMVLIIHQAQANEVVKITTSLSGGITGIQTSIRPNIEFDANQSIFDHLVITKADIGKEYTISSNQDDPQFSTFAQKITDADDDLMKVGHTIGLVKGNLGNYETTWFNEKDLYQKSISKISIQYSKVEFEEPFFKENDYWTNFTYEVTITFHLTKKANLHLSDFAGEKMLFKESKRKKVTTDEFMKKKTPKTPKQKFKLQIEYTPKQEKKNR